MNCRFSAKRLLLILFFVGVATTADAQLSKNAQEVWPSIDMYYRFNPKLRLYGTMAGTKQESSYAEGAVGVFVDYFTFPFTTLIRKGHAETLPGQYLWLRAGYQYSATPQSTADPFRESMFVAEGNSRFYLPFDILMSVKNRFDFRFSEGDVKGRYRPRVSLDKDMHTDFLFFTLSGLMEYYANFGNGSVNRFRSQLGVEIKVTKKINYEVFWSHQFANQPEIPTVDAFGMTLKFYLHKKQKDSTAR